MTREDDGQAPSMLARGIKKRNRQESKIIGQGQAGSAEMKLAIGIDVDPWLATFAAVIATALELERQCVITSQQVGGQCYFCVLRARSEGNGAYSSAVQPNL